MNDDYENHIFHKYRLAVALGIIKNTPENSSPKKYLEHLRNIIISKMEFYDPDMTICEDDFDLNDDKNVTYDNDKNDKVINEQNPNNELQLNDSQTNDSITILKDFDFNVMIQNINNEGGRVENNSVSDVLRILKGVDNRELLETEIAFGSVVDHTQLTQYVSPQSLTQETKIMKDKNIGQIQNNIEKSANTVNVSHYDSNKEVINAINNAKTGVTSEEYATYYDSPRTNAFHGHTDNLTHVSQSQVDNIIIPRYLIEKEKPKDKKLKTPENVKIIDTKISNVIYRKTGTDNVVNNNVKIFNDDKNASEENNDIDNIKNKRSRKLNDYIHSDTDTAYFNEIKRKFKMNASDSNTDVIVNNPIEGKEPFRNLFNSDNPVLNTSNVLYDIIDTHQVKTGIDKRNLLDNFGSQISVGSNNTTSKLGYSSQKFSQFSQEFDSEQPNKIEANIASNLTKALSMGAKESDEERAIEDLFDELTDSQSETVPFKVLEELNKVKTFLNRRDRNINLDCVSDSGYKSDSQSRNSIKNAVQSSNVWINQSAHCLLSYLSQCPLVLNTEEITKEISRTLGRLIDRLHEHEKYPSFIEDHLHTIDCLLKDIYEEDSADKLLQKDEAIYRLFLLNKSSHVTKYTTEKIIAILEQLLTTLAKDELLETSRPIQTENLAYIFHILETLIKKLVVHKNFSSQHSTQNSQEDEGILKKSSITEIWRKKWNPVKKTDSDTTSNVKPCVLVRCSDVLNKLIVQAMDGYSLISYYALQCFNLLQN